MRKSETSATGSIDRDQSEVSIPAKEHGLGRATEPGASFEMPKLSFGQNAIYAATAREAGRLNALSVSQEEYDAWLAERQELLDRKFSGSLTRAEARRLEYVRWSLDRIEDARTGAALDALESQVHGFESLLQEIRGIHQQFERHAQRR